VSDIKIGEGFKLDLKPAGKAGEAPTADAFSSALEDAFKQVEQSAQETGKAVDKLSTGDDLMSVIAQADTSYKQLMELQSKLLNRYKEAG
jgi:flagellar hook-basal body complex protein FliE